MRRRLHRQVIIRVAGVAAAVILIAVATFYAPASARLRNFFGPTGVWLIAPLHNAGRIIGNSKNQVLDLLTSYRDNQALREQQSEMLVDKAAFLLLQNENQALRSALGIAEEGQRAVAYAAIIGGFAEGRDEYWIINAGISKNIHEGQTVLSADGVMAGIVRTVSQNTATVRLLASPSESLTVTLLPAKIDALLRGDNNGEYVLSLVPDSVEVSRGDVVVTAGRNPGVPSELPVGSVVSIEKRSAESFQDVRLKAPATLQFIDHVIILIDSPVE